METKLIAVDPRRPSPQAIAEAAAIIKAGRLVAFPTETVYGLAANALDAEAVARIFAAKGRPPQNPIIVHVADHAELAAVAADWPPLAAKLAARFWPGPLTLVVKKHPQVPEIVTAGGPTVAVRMPSHPIALALIRAAQSPLAAPSANVSSQISATRAEHVLRGLDGRIELVLDGGPTPGGLESTVLDVTASPPRLLRPGLATTVEIEAVIGPIAGVDRATAGGYAPAEEPAAEPLRSPGMLSRHYAPQVPLECLPEGDDLARIEDLRHDLRRLGWLTFGPVDSDGSCGVLIIEMPTDPQAYAAQLYAALHALEAAEVERIIVTLPPGGDAWLAIRDRLRRASAAQ